ncbi:hypothetical protein Tco_0471091 [Tanacetum coccineum]
MEEGRINGNELKTELKEIPTQIIKLQKNPRSTDCLHGQGLVFVLDSCSENEKLTKSFSLSPFCFNGTEGAVGLIRWFERNRIYISLQRDVLEENNVHCYWTEIRKMEDELYNLSVKGNDLKPYVRRFQELTTLCPNMVPNNEKLLEAFIGGLPRSIEGNVTASKPQTLESHQTYPRWLMDTVY